MVERLYGGRPLYMRISKFSQAYVPFQIAILSRLRRKKCALQGIIKVKTMIFMYKYVHFWPAAGAKNMSFLEDWRQELKTVS